MGLYDNNQVLISIERDNYYKDNVLEMIEKHPDRVITLAVKRMLPKTKLGSKLINKLKVYKGDVHPHSAQNPVVLEVK